MNKFYHIAEKVTSILLILLGLSLLWLSIESIQILHDFVNGDGTPPGLSNNYYGYFKAFHLVIIFAVVAMISGILLLKSKKFGWISSIIVLIGFPLSILLRNWLNPESDFYNPNSDTIAAIVITVAVLCLGIFQFSKPYRQKYHIISGDYMLINLAMAIIVLDVFIFSK